MKNYKELSFSECIEQTKEKKRHLILGNGFSVGLFKNIFNYDKLKKAVEKDGFDEIFKKFNTYDFEYVMRKIFEAKEVLTALNYENISEIKEDLENKYNTLSEILIKTITENHPKLPTEITENNYKSCIEFLKNFEKKYTFNYDLLLYWILMKSENKCNDGFGNGDKENEIVWSIGNEYEQNLYYIHGAIHLFQDTEKLIKYNFSRTQIPIQKQVDESIKKGRLPLFIAEGLQEQKKNRIQSNGYLSRTFSSLKGISQQGGTIFIYGHSLRNEDDYVYNHIFKSYKIKSKNNLNIYISYYGDEGRSKIIEKINIWKTDVAKKENIYFYIYESSSANVWNNSQEIEKYVQ